MERFQLQELYLIQMHGRWRQRLQKKKSWQRRWSEETKGRGTFEFIPVVGTRIIWPKSRNIGISYCRMLLHDTMLNKDSYRTGTSDTASCECGEDEETVVHMLSYCSRHSHARTQLNFTLDRQRTHGQLVTKPGFFWHHHLKTTLVRETISF